MPRLQKILKILILFALILLTLRLFFLDAYTILTKSMENTIRAGDFILVNKFVYGAKTPEYIPILNFDIPGFRMPRMRSPEKNDVVVIEKESLPVDLRGYQADFIKRIIAGPEDTLEIRNNAIYINGVRVKKPEGVIFGLNRDDKRSLFPERQKWSKDNYGPITVPKAGTKIRLTAENYRDWIDLIKKETYPESDIRVNGGIIIDDKKLEEYEIRNNYYFVMGDNRNNSIDSRYWGFIDEESIIGKVFLVYWSIDPSVERSGISGFFSGIRWNRIGAFID